MAKVNGLTKERMTEIEANCIVNGAVDLSGMLKLTKQDGTTFNAGQVAGNRWGTTHTWVFGSPQTNVEVFYLDDLPPRVGDMIVGDNGFDVGQLSIVANVVDETHADLMPFSTLRGPQGTPGSALSAYPVGSVYMSVNSTSPATLFGGTWARLANGRVLVGVDESDTDFNASKKTGGEKAHALTTSEMPGHSHTINHDHASQTSSADSHSHTFSIEWDTNDATTGSARRVFDVGNLTGGTGGNASTVTTSSDSHSHTVDLPSYSGSSGTAGNGANGTAGVAHNNMSPFLSVYIWERTA